MPFREKAKALLKARPRSPPPNPTLPTHAVTPAESHTVYGSHEQIPGPKYRRPPAKEHTEKLEAFSFADAWRKKSFQSARSPMGTRVSSRRNSVFSRKSSYVSETTGAGASRQGSVTEESSNGADLGREETVKPVAVDGSAEAGLSQQRTVQQSAYPEKKKKEQVTGNGTSGVASDHQAFSEEDFAHAMQRSHLYEVPAQS